MSTYQCIKCETIYTNEKVDEMNNIYQGYNIVKVCECGSTGFKKLSATRPKYAKLTEF